jgi:hypothetical protein
MHAGGALSREHRGARPERLSTEGTTLVKIRSLRVRICTDIPGQPFKPGDEVDVDPTLAAQWIGAGHAVAGKMDPSEGGFSFESGDEIDIDDPHVVMELMAAGIVVAKYPC